MINLKKIALERVNLKVDLTFWTFLPYVETISYIINNKTYRPSSYRFLCFALIIVTSKDEVSYELDKNIEKVFNKSYDKVNNTRR